MNLSLLYCDDELMIACLSVRSHKTQKLHVRNKMADNKTKNSLSC